MAEAEQQIDVGGPRADAVQRRQRVVRGVGVLFRQHVEVQPLGGEFARDVLQRLDLGGRKPEPAEAVGARLADGVVIERIERGREASPDRRGTRGGELLAADDRGQAGKTRLALPQRRHARQLEDRLQPHVLLDQRVDGVFEIGLAVEVDGHCPLKPSCPAKEINAATRFPICAEPERLPPSRPRLFGAAEFRPGAPKRRPVPAADRGYRRDAVPAGIRGGDLRRPRLARHILGNAGAAAIGTFCALSARRSKNWQAWA